MNKTYFGFATDHTGSMGSIRRQAARDYNSTIASVKASAEANNQDVVVSHVKIGHMGDSAPHLTIRNSSISALTPIDENNYDVSANSTRLFDSVVALVDELKRAPDANDANVAFAVMITTDGGNNDGRTTGTQLAKLIAELQSTDKWTFVFRVPKGGYSELLRLGIPDGNIMVWDTTSAKGMETATTQNVQAMDQFFTARATGQKATRSFYANLKDVTSEDVKAALTDVSTKVTLWPVAESEHDMQIRDFVEKRLNGKPLKKGGAFYQLTKSEDKVQASKKICIRDKSTNAIYFGDAARQMMGMPKYDDVRLKPADLGNFDVFIQSTSVNRKVQKGSQILYWEEVGVAYTEGPSAR